MGKLIDLTGKKFGRLVVVKRVGKNKHRQSIWLCQCNCGKETIVRGYKLKSGHTKSCGCLRKEIVQKTMTKHGHYKNKKMSATYNSWSHMIQRCTNLNHKNYKSYGGRGIKVCERWKNSFSNFLEDMGERPDDFTLERKNNDKGYCKSNCK